MASPASTAVAAIMQSIIVPRRRPESLNSRAASAASAAVKGRGSPSNRAAAPIAAGDTGLLMIGGGSPKNFAQDTVVCAEILGHDVPMHKYSVQITVADVRDGACSSSSLKEAMSWGKVDAATEQMVFAEATLALPLLAAYGYHNGSWKKRPRRQLARSLAA